MKIITDYSEIGKNLVEAGYADYIPYSIKFDRYFTEEEKQENAKNGEMMSDEEWDIFCEQFSQELSKEMKEILKVLVDRYDIHQASKETSTMKHYKTDWDLFFYSPRGWNKKDYYDWFTLDFNERRSLESITATCEEVKEIASKLEPKNVACYVKYKPTYNFDKIKKLIDSSEIVGSSVKYHGLEGKIKVVGDNDYGFFKKCARTRYLPLKMQEVATIILN